MKLRGRQKGFTLLELVISLALLGLIALIVGSALRVSLRAVSSGEKKVLELERFRTSLGVMEAQISSALPLQQQADGTVKSTFSGQRGALSLATCYSLWKGQAGYVIAGYLVEPGPDGRQELRMSEHTVGVEDAQETVLLTGYDEIAFSFYARQAVEAEGTWTEEWSDETLLPEKVRLTLRQGASETRLVMPLRVRGPEDWIALLPGALAEQQ